jgi:hypothetical protein
MAAPTMRDQERERRILDLQRFGFRGGRILPHRAMIGLTVGWGLVVDLLVLPALSLAVLALLRDPVTGLWHRFFLALAGPLGFPGGVSVTRWELGPTAVMLPAFAADAPWPGTTALVLGWVVTALLAVGGVLVRGWATPLGYLLRAMAAIQLTAQLWFTLAAPPFTYTLQGYQEAVMYLGCVVVFLVPVGTALTFNPFDFRLWQKVALTAMIVAHLVVLIPLQVATHAFLVRHLTLLAMPMLYLLFGILLHVFAFVSLYGWGMSWRSHGELDAGERRPPAPSKARRPTPAIPGGGDPEAGRRAKAAREAADLAAALTSSLSAPLSPTPATTPATASVAPTAGAAPAVPPVAAARASAAATGLPSEPWPSGPAIAKPAPGAASVESSPPARSSAAAAPRVVPPRPGSRVPLLFGGDRGGDAPKPRGKAS